MIDYKTISYLRINNKLQLHYRHNEPIVILNGLLACKSELAQFGFACIKEFEEWWFDTENLFPAPNY